ncbi:MAG: hypothetical protein HY720_13590 [Planctomycetes bacterium]|nr:hypothetical protein [Planctomycetota bacterium]
MNRSRFLLVSFFPLALFLASVFLFPGGSVPADDGTGEEGADPWTSIHRARAEEGRESLRKELNALRLDAETRLAALAEKVAKREASLASLRAGLLAEVDAARAEAARIKSIHDFYAGGMEKADVLYSGAKAIDLRYNQLQSDITFLESYVPVVRHRIELTDDPLEKKDLELSLANDLLAPLQDKKAKLDEIRAEHDRVKGARDAFYQFYESRMQTYMAEMGKAQAKVKLMEEDLSNLPYDLDEDHPELTLSEEEAKVWERAALLEKALSATPEIREEAVVTKCLLCHFTPDEGYFLSGRLAFADHPRLSERAGNTCEGCHGGDAAALSARAAGHEVMTPRLLAAGGTVDLSGERRPLVTLGEELYGHYRCHACHELPGEDPVFRRGPNLDGLNGRIGYDWAIRSLTGPDAYPESYTMPRYGLSEVQAHKIALFLWQSVHVHGAGVPQGNAPAKKPEGIEEEPKAEDGGQGDDHSSHSHGSMDLGVVVTGYDVRVGANLFHELGCLGCHQIRGTEEPAGITESLPGMGLRLARPYPPDGSLYPAGTVIDAKILNLLKMDGVRSIDVVSEAPLDPILVSQRAVLAEGYPQDDPVYPAGTAIDEEVYDFLKREKVRRVRLAGRGNDFAPDLTHAGSKSQKAHLVHWIQDPAVALADAVMPSFRLDEKESWLIATYLDHRRMPGAPPAIKKGLWTEQKRETREGLDFVLSASAPRLAAGPEVDFALEVKWEGTGEPIQPDEFEGVSLALQTVRGSGEDVWLEIQPYVDEKRGAFEFFFRFGEALPHRLRASLSSGPGRPGIEVVFDVDIRPKEESVEAEGKELVRTLACASCHKIPEFPEPPARRDLGRMVKERLSSAGPGDLASWLSETTAHHGIKGGDEGPVDSWTLEEGETRALVAYMFDRARRGNGPPRSAREAVLHQGDRIVQRFNCRGCHSFAYPKDKYAKKGTFAPNLGIAGLRYRPGYLVRFLESPDPVRSGSGNPVMPTFNMTAEDREDLALYFQELSRGTGEAELVRAAAAALPPAKNGDPARGEELVKEHRCRSCHLVGDDKKPLDDFTDYKREELERHRKRAPHLVDLGRRLDPDWMAAWIMDPHKFLPDTPMPDPEITIEDAASIREYLLTFRTPAPKKPDGAKEGEGKDEGENPKDGQEKPDGKDR